MKNRRVKDDAQLYLPPLEGSQEAEWIAEHDAAMKRLPDWVAAQWKLYDANRAAFPFGFAHHFPKAWNWKGESDDV